MIKTFATVTALSALLIAPAVAQTNPTPPKASDKPAMSEPAKPATPAPAPSASSTKSDSSTTAAAPSASPADTASAKPAVVDSQSPEQWLASSFKGTDVLGPDDKKIGDVNDILFAKDGSVKAYVVGVGGFLGIGSKDVALAPSSFQVVPGKDPSDTKLKVSMNKDELKQATAFKPYKAPSTASTTGMSGRQAPAGGRPAGMH
jgi:hypothetical protein